MPTINVSIIEDDAKTRKSFAMLVEGTPGFACVSSHPSAEDALEKMPARTVEVALVDIKLPRQSGIECVRQLKQKHPHLLLIMLTIVDDAGSIFEALAAGAHGYILKTTPPAQIMQAISEAVAGGSPMSSAIARKVIQHFHGLPPRNLGQLTPRELQILEQLAEGYTDKEIGNKLGIAGDTVRGGLQKIYKKLHVTGRIRAVRRFLGK